MKKSKLFSSLLAIGSAMTIGAPAHALQIDEVFVMDLSNPGPDTVGAPLQISGEFIYDTVLSEVALVNLSLPLSQFFWPVVGSVTPITSGPNAGLQSVLWESLPVSTASGQSSSIGMIVSLPLPGGFATTPFASFAGYETSKGVFGNYNVAITAVPEPQALSLLISGLGLVGWATRRRSSPLSDRN